MEEYSHNLEEWQDVRQGEKNTALREEDPALGVETKKKHHWPTIHMEHYRTHGLRYPPDLELLYTDAELQTLSLLPRRTQEVIAFADLHGRASAEEVIYPSQSINRFPRLVDRGPAHDAKGFFWLRERFRRMEPNEYLALQGWAMLQHQVIALAFAPAEIQSLVGIDFNASTAMAMTIAAMAVIAVGGFEP